MKRPVRSPASSSPRACLGIFVGGASRRMGGLPKGLLPAPDGTGTLVERLVRVGEEAGLEPVLVGEARPYRELVPEVTRISDTAPGGGPLFGLHALLVWAKERDALAVGCDMPFVDAGVLRSIASAKGMGSVLAVREGGRFEPLLTRYRSPYVLPVLELALSEGLRSFQALFERLQVDLLPASAAVRRALIDWDAPAAVRKRRPP